MATWLSSITTGFISIWLFGLRWKLSFWIEEGIFGLFAALIFNLIFDYRFLHLWSKFSQTEFLRHIELSLLLDRAPLRRAEVVGIPHLWILLPLRLVIDLLLLIWFVKLMRKCLVPGVENISRHNTGATNILAIDNHLWPVFVQKIDALLIQNHCLFIWWYSILVGWISYQHLVWLALI